jgi:hypothetical protein
VNELPLPLVPADVDLRKFPFMPLHVRELRDSDFVATASGDAFRAAILLWCAAWHQLPAGSLPDDNRTLANLAGYGRDLSGWQEVRPMALDGFILCSDGRLYHPMLAKSAVHVWRQREKYRV